MNKTVVIHQLSTVFIGSEARCRKDRLGPEEVKNPAWACQKRPVRVKMRGEGGIPKKMTQTKKGQK